MRSLTLLFIILCAFPPSAPSHEISFMGADHFKPVSAMSVPKLLLEDHLSPVAVYVAPKAPQPVSTASGASNCGSDPYMAYIYEHESGCCPTKWQGQAYCPDTFYPSLSSYDASVGYGLCQSTPAIKMATVGADWGTNWAVQDSWCRSYAVVRYGSTYGAYLHWLSSHNW